MVTEPVAILNIQPTAVRGGAEELFTHQITSSQSMDPNHIPTAARLLAPQKGRLYLPLIHQETMENVIHL